MLIVGHRGAAGLKPENTLAAIKEALDARVDMIEIDVRVCGTGEVVLHHDESFIRTARILGWINRMSLKDIKKIKFGGEQIPTLEEALNFIDGKVPVNIEIKDGAEKTAEVVEKFLKKRPNAKIIICSKRKSELEIIQKLHPKLEYGLVTPGIFKSDIDWAIEKKCKFVSVFDFFVRKKYIRTCIEKGLDVYMYPLGGRAKINTNKIKELGLCGVILNYPPHH